VTSKNNNTRIAAPNGDSHLIGNKTIVTFKADSIPLTPGDGEPSTSQTFHKPIEETSTKKWAMWGDNDNFPLEFQQKLDKLGVALTGIEKNADMHYGNGIGWFKKKVTEKGKIVYMPVVIPEWDAFCENSGFELILADTIQSLETYYIAFVEIILNKAKNKPHSVNLLDTPYCRLEKKVNGKINNMYFVHDIDKAGNDFSPIPMYDPKEPFKYKKCAVVLKYRCFGMPYYAIPNLYSTFLNKWADVAISVPGFLNAIYKNSATLKYHITIPISALKQTYPNYFELTPEEQIAKQEEKKSEIDQAIASSEKAGISVMSVYDDESGYEPIKIEPIKAFIDAQKELPNAQAANSEILFSLGTDPSLVGFGVPGGKNLSGSGSDKRESRENSQKSLKRERLVSLQLAKIIMNMIKPNLEAGVFPAYIDADTSQTLDENPTGSQNIVS
jgi:hypothetical protein